MVRRLENDARFVIKNARQQARTCRSPLIEAEHLLLAMAAQPGTAAASVLASAGLTHRAIAEALDREFEASLTTAGVTFTAGELPRPSEDAGRRPGTGASFKSAMRRSVVATAGAKQIRTEHLLLGVLAAEVGTVPRALTLAGVDPGELTSRTYEELRNR